MVSRPVSTGYCFCGCGEKVGPTAFFVSGHDKVAESALIRSGYGTVAGFVEAHQKYRTDVRIYKRPPGFRATCPELDLSLEGTELYALLQEMKAEITRELERRDRDLKELIHPSSFALATSADEVVTITVDHPRDHTRRPRAPAESEP